MTERLADVSARIDGVRQLGAVVNAMKGIAAARARSARAQLGAVDSYAATISAAMARLVPADGGAPVSRAPTDTSRTGLLVFLAEQGFAGAFSERVLDSISAELGSSVLLVVGTRGLSIAASRDLDPYWSAPMPSHSPGIPKLADAITQAIYRALDGAHFEHLDVIHARWKAGRTEIARRSLFPIDLSDLHAPAGPRPLTQLPPEALLASFGADYVHAQVCKAALHAFAAENEARMEAMTSAASQIARELETFQATLRRVRQEAITAEIIELGTGATISREAD
ncbi:F0F1 ATP synthase subunit gamma [Thioclava sp. 15-R06ZXC-3]|uniref:F0F1 ATP synthase subunit gamma n=1 Tax=Thioclava arctica TaxID=3238301 RepID=A0ABV3TGN5_9RHOB